MQKIKTPKFGLQYFYVLVMLSYTFYVFNFVPILDRHWIFMIIAFILPLAYTTSYFGHKTFFAMMLYIGIVVLNYFGGDYFFNNYAKVIDEFIQLFIPSSMLYYLLKYRDYKLYRTMLVFFGVVLTYSTIISFIADQQYPGIMRLESFQANIEANAAILMPFFRIGLSDYTLPHALPVIAPGLIYCIRRKTGWWRIFLWIVLAASAVLTYVSGSFTAFMMEIVVVLISFLIGRNNKRGTRRSIILITVVALPFILSTQLQYQTLHSLKGIFDSDGLTYHKLDDLEQSILSSEATGSLEAREEKYESTIEVIVNNILIGTNTEQTGGHSSIPDRLALLGLVGFIPYILFIYLQTKFTLLNIAQNKRIYYLIGIAAGLIMMTVKSMSSWQMWFLFLAVLPGLLLFVDDDVEYNTK